MQRLLMLLCWLIIACHSTTDKQPATIADTLDKSLSTIQKTDTTTESSITAEDAYLAGLPTRRVAALIMADSITPRDNAATFACIDSAIGNNAATRAYYLPVFTKIVDKSDGALSEAVSVTIVSYIETFPKEFIAHTITMTQKQMELWAGFVAFELASHEEALANTKKWTEQLMAQCTDCHEQELKKLVVFNGYVTESVKKNIEDEKKQTL